MAKYNIQRGGGISHFIQDVNANHHSLRNVEKLTVDIIEAQQITLNPEIGDFYSGYPLQVEYGEELNALTLISINPTNGKYYKSQIDVSTDHVIAISLENGEMEKSHKVLILGFVQSSLFSFTTGSLLYLGSTPGSIVETPPGGYDERQIGIALSSTKILFKKI
jgi:hypothetical protein